jgi:quercetin dioxygenase-like cupin family protein
LPAGALALAGGVILAAAGCVQAGPSPSSQPGPSGAIVRTELGSTLPGNAPGQRLGLWHYTIPAGTALVPHRHPGWQVARIASGTLTYTILSGTVTVFRAAGNQESYGPGQSIKLGPGDTVIETPDVHHFGANEGTEPVEIYTSTLLSDGEPVAIPLATGGPSPSS